MILKQTEIPFPEKLLMQDNLLSSVSSTRIPSGHKIALPNGTLKFKRSQIGNFNLEYNSKDFNWWLWGITFAQRLSLNLFNLHDK